MSANPPAPTYHAFLSHDPADEGVDDWLLPRLEAAALRIVTTAEGRAPVNAY